MWNVANFMTDKVSRFLGECCLLLPFLCNYDNLPTMIIDRLKVGSVPGMSDALLASNKSIKIYHEYDARPLIHSCNCY